LSALPEAAAWGAAVGLSLLVGVGAASRLHLPAPAAAALTMFGGGLLLSAVAFELVPDADAAGGTVLTAAGLLTGTAIYVAADAWLHRDPRSSQMREAVHAASTGRMMDMPDRGPEGRALAAGLFIDGVPESLALGLTIAEGELGLALLAGVLVGNVVEA
jgi:zinc transporter, ZIP family